MDDPISHKKCTSGDAAWNVQKDLLGITFDGVNKTLWLFTKNATTSLLHSNCGSALPLLRKAFHSLSSNQPCPRYATHSSQFHREIGYYPPSTHSSLQNHIRFSSTEMQTSTKQSETASFSSGILSVNQRSVSTGSQLGRIVLASSKCQGMAVGA